MKDIVLPLCDKDVIKKKKRHYMFFLSFLLFRRIDLSCNPPNLKNPAFLPLWILL